MITEVTVQLPALSLEIIIRLAASLVCSRLASWVISYRKGVGLLAVCCRWWVESICINGLPIAPLYIQSLILFTEGKGRHKVSGAGQEKSLGGLNFTSLKSVRKRVSSRSKEKR